MKNQNLNLVTGIKMINVQKPYIETQDNHTRICCDFQLNDEVKTLWYEIDKDYTEYLSLDSCDAFFTILTLLASIKGHDISFEAPVSKRLYYGFLDILMPALRIVNPDLMHIKVNAHTKEFDFKPKAVGTALSLGVDSFHALVSSMNTDYPVTHLTLFNSGAFGHEEHTVARELFKKTIQRVALAAQEMDLPLIAVDSNMSEILDISFVQTHSIRNLSFTLLFPKLFKKFYYASGYHVTEFRIDSKGATAAHYDLLVAKALCTENLEVMIAGLYDNRIDKILTISSFVPSTHHLNVCILADSNQFLNSSESLVKNCSRCFKCVKTMTALDALDALDAYSEVFDLKLYGSKKHQYLGQIIYDAKKLKSTHALEILQAGKNKSQFLSWQSHYYAIYRGLSNLKKKIYKNTKKNNLYVSNNLKALNEGKHK